MLEEKTNISLLKIFAEKTQQKKIPSESARARAQEDSSTDTMVTDPGPESTMSITRRPGEHHRNCRSYICSSAPTLQICACGWRKVTSYHRLRIHQGKRKCSGNQRQGPRIDYLLSKESSQSNKAQQPDLNHSLKCISTTVTEGVPSSTEMVTSENPTQLSRPAIERRLVGHRPRVKWPAAAYKKQWEAINSDLSLTLEQLKGTMEKKLESMGDIITLWYTRRERPEKVSNCANLQEATRDQAPHPTEEAASEAVEESLGGGKGRH